MRFITWCLCCFLGGLEDGKPEEGETLDMIATPLETSVISVFVSGNEPLLMLQAFTYSGIFLVDAIRLSTSYALHHTLSLYLLRLILNSS